MARPSALLVPAIEAAGRATTAVRCGGIPESSAE
jgi:hypothetical protein